ncbi:TIGR03013 family PEP-CTERM/XrtA system glycosyltransferase [Betaproteobacteria bacterium SCN1]|nr:TIGR03013 family PEP-CTERM/XrtA system glycosyltransferase [Betaproteobacteria bacterium SCN1]MBN8760864.1 TIGR03013 family PEP-CTERM/XrtA system glycosyltransferase [Thiobacillus sp.]ODU90641.1 MAG: exopolysaccharide biosynthesis polyprenyl glycosylphosphotransferase [Thiobacillus sp. SCN 65-179]OJW35931.1 MAG: exopolysaccharide biosynthesis polyprenyl glycosylphosphotransferase [Thiobacillus sp. 65-69]
MIRFFRHYVPLNLLLLVMLEALILCGAMYLGVSARFLDSHAIPDDLNPLLPKATTFTLVMLGLMTASGLYDLESRGGIRALLQRLGLSFGLGLVTMSLLFYFFPALLVGRGAFLLAFGLALFGILVSRALFIRWARVGVLKKRALVLGTGSRAAHIEALLARRGPASNTQVVGYLPMGGSHHFVDHARILDTQESLSELATRLQVSEIILAVRDRRGGGMPVQSLLECKLRGINILELSSFFERENGHLQLDSMNASWMILAEGFTQGMLRDTVKRLFDLLVSAAMLAVTLPIMALATLLIKLESPGPVLYRQERVGQGGRSFTILKFRSMCADAEKDGKPRWAGQNDSRVTLVGRFIRRTRIDELPQIFNVFFGEMSFVGPRPERPYFVQDLTQKIPYYGVRHTVKPGITGWAQVRYPYGASDEDAMHKLQYDLYYVKNHSLFLDLMILFQTAQVVLWGKGVR